ncbi:MAG: hypothetical protein COT39_00825 [Parcubacteria group bacterium CG08_land_8_20_14_0_20_48_21]|nr:MAG: hypothetical protein AUK21_01120 [Parcubacteria group bacterium CG2_30_48_51]PIS33137.1 MAG: hypothetical protein COT39_00825 [Parcubacteria group bacterium CG08_land_8_20_14_0_20_48_21]PIW79346.1 MAG: hypothetical protein COZ99_01575 [Parcubacteria group bacterium CG_4_8_14_3_um_filter_48_16]PIY78404.1 MAG: hypothetical protein COY83_00115 [Parcubacteria group bacterium CG_4_10_14_0_8_um_filter_48_154]PIZ76856.1 MAG: hypothetical protein COY03_04475 [bacterium CG_4_10_14_0_2_um_filter_
MRSIVLQSLKFITLDLLGDIMLFPLWWYTKGLQRYANLMWENVHMVERHLGVFIWTKNILRPMFGQYDWQGRIISFFMRLVNIIFRGGVLLIWSLLCAALFMLWIAFPLLMIWLIALQSGVSLA